LPCRQKRLVAAHLSTPFGIISETCVQKQADHPPKKILGLSTLSGTPKNSLVGKGTIDYHTVQISTFKRNRVTEKAPVRRDSTGLEIRGKCPKYSLN
jgi:hypothetical protein